MKKLLFLIMFLSLPCIYALDSAIYKGWVTAGVPFSAGNDTFLPNYLPETNTTVIRLPEGFSAVIYASSMNCTQEWLYKICQDKQKFTLKGVVVRPDVRSNELNVSLFLRINKTIAGLGIDRQISKKNLFIGDIAEIKLTLDKIGPAEVYNISFTDVFPGADVESLSSRCLADGDRISLNLPVFEGGVVCVYIVMPKTAGTIVNRAVLSYSVLGKPITKTINASFSVSDFPVSVKINASNYKKVQERQQIILKVENNKDAELKELVLYLPASFAVINRSAEFTMENNKAKLKYPKNTTYVLVYNSTFSGNFTANLSLAYSYNRVLSEFKKTQKIEVLPLFPDVLLLSSGNGSVLRISNTANISFKNIKIYVNGNYFELPLLEKSRYKEFAYAGISNKTTLLLTFQSQFGQAYNESYLLRYGGEVSVQNNSSVKSKGWGFKFPSITLPKEVLVVGVVVFLIVVLGFFIKSGPKKTWLDKEIEEIKKKDEESK